MGTGGGSTICWRNEETFHLFHVPAGIRSSAGENLPLHRERPFRDVCLSHSRPHCNTGIRDLSVSNLFWCTMATEFLFESSLLCRRIQWNTATVEISWSVRKKKKKKRGGEIKKKRVDVIEVSVREQNWNQRVTFKWKTASQSSLSERQHLQLFCCSLSLLLSQFLHSEPHPTHTISVQFESDFQLSLMTPVEFCVTNGTLDWLNPQFYCSVHFHETWCEL